MPVEMVQEDTAGSVSGPVAKNGAAPTVEQPRSQFKLRCPMDFRPKDIPEDGIYGIFRVSRYPMLWFSSIYSLSVAFMTPFVTEVVMFTSPLLVTALLTEHMDNRFRRGIGGSLSPERDAATSNVPFGAFVRGKQSLTQLVSEIKWVNVGCAVGLAVLLHAARMRRLPLHGMIRK